jgi:hypothetical protein
VTRRAVFTPEVIALMRRMKREGATPREIADEIGNGTTAGSVAARCAQLGINRGTGNTLTAGVGQVVVEKFANEASRRKMPTSLLVRDILRKVALDNLFAAVIDD